MAALKESTERIAALEQKDTERENVEDRNARRNTEQKGAEEERFKRLELHLTEASNRAEAAELRLDILSGTTRELQLQLSERNSVPGLTSEEVEELIERRTKVLVKQQAVLVEDNAKLRAEMGRVNRDLQTRFDQNMTTAFAALDQQRAVAFSEHQNRLVALFNHTIAQAITQSEVGAPSLSLRFSD